MEPILSDQLNQSELTALVVRHQQAVYAYIYSLLPDRSVAEEVLQETFVTVCEKSDQFEPGTNFVAWVRSIAFWKVRQAKASYVRSRLVFSDSLMPILNDEFAEFSGELARRHEMLDACLSKLQPRDRQLILERYQSGSKIEDAARKTGRSVHAAYKALSRIRQRLMTCVEQGLAREGACQ